MKKVRTTKGNEKVNRGKKYPLKKYGFPKDNPKPKANNKTHSMTGKNPKVSGNEYKMGAWCSEQEKRVSKVSSMLKGKKY